jgi:hypothetical protein
MSWVGFCLMHSEEGTKQLLEQYYNLDAGEFSPVKRPKSEWKHDNKFGFLLGLAEHGRERDKRHLHEMLAQNEFSGHEVSFIDSMFDSYIRPFHKCYHTPSGTPSYYNSKSRHSLARTPKLFRSALVERDLICLFCWESSQCEGAHIIARKNIAIQYEESSILALAGLTHIDKVENGLLLCRKCHDSFDKLEMYVDVVEERLILKAVRGEMLDVFRNIKRDREAALLDVANIEKKNREVVVNGEILLFFARDVTDQQPNKKALQYHKAACIIWRMAGGAEPDNECLYKEDRSPVAACDLSTRLLAME